MNTHPFAVTRREAQEITETPYGSVGVLHASVDLKAWWIWKEDEDVDPEWKINSRDDFLCVVQGSLKLQLKGEGEVVLAAGDAIVIPAHTPFRGFRWPRDTSEPCLFVAVSRGDVETTSERSA